MKGKKKEEVTPSSFDNSKPFVKAITMIILSFIKVKKNVENVVQKYKEIANFGLLECPNCHSKDYIRWGFYERGIIYYKNNKVHYETITIQRIKCKSCDKTHALLPFGIVPYKQITDEVIVDILLEDNLLFSEDTITRWKKQFKKYHLPFLVTILNLTNINDIILALKKQKDKILSEYIIKTNRCFMQIKLGFLGMCSI